MYPFHLWIHNFQVKSTFSDENVFISDYEFAL